MVRRINLKRDRNNGLELAKQRSLESSLQEEGMACKKGLAAGKKNVTHITNDGLKGREHRLLQ
jgi:hypothetical protein